MGTISAGIRKGDVVLATLSTALGVVLMVANTRSGTDPDVRIDSTSWLMVPVFAAVTLPVLWRRRNLPVVLVVTAVALAVHVLAFGWVVRCGAGLPLAFALAYAAGRLVERRTSVLALLGTLVIQVLVLVQDSAAGSEILPVTAAIGVAAWGVGVWLRRRSTAQAVAQDADTVATYA